MVAVAQAKGIDKTQLSRRHRKQPKKTFWTIKSNSNLLFEMGVRALLSVIAKRDATIGLHNFRDNLSMAMTKRCSLKKPTTASWSNGSCNTPTFWSLCWIWQYSLISNLQPIHGFNLSFDVNSTRKDIPMTTFSTDNQDGSEHIHPVIKRLPPTNRLDTVSLS